MRRLLIDTKYPISPPEKLSPAWLIGLVPGAGVVLLLEASQPAHGVLDDLQHGLFVKDPVGFVARPEIEDFALVDIPHCGGTKPFPGGPALLDNHLVGFGNIEGFVVHLGIGDSEISRQALCNGMIRLQ